MTGAFVAKDHLHIQMEIDPENPCLDVDSTAGKEFEFSFTAYTCLSVPARLSPQGPTKRIIDITDDSPADTAYATWLVEYPLDKTVSFTVKKQTLEADLKRELEGLPTVAFETAHTLALKGFEALADYEDGETDYDSWFC